MEERKIKWGILSTGRIAKIFIDGLKHVPNCEAFAVGSRNIEKAKKFAEENGVVKFYGSYEELVKDPDVDVVYIGAPHTYHFEYTMLTLKNGKHVLCEKPLAMNKKEVELMIKKAEEKNLFLMEALWSRFLPNIQKVKEIIDSGELGRIKLLTAYFAFRSVGDSKHRHFNKELGGGSLLDIGIYNVFLSLLLLGLPKKINAIAGMRETDVDTTCSFTFQYERETLAVMFSSFAAQTPIIAEIHCEKGKIFLEHVWFCPSAIKITDLQGNEKRIEFNFIGNGYNYEADEVNKCIRNGKIQSDLWSWKDSLRLIETLDLIRKEIGLIYPNHDSV